MFPTTQILLLDDAHAIKRQCLYLSLKLKVLKTTFFFFFANLIL